MNDARDKKWTPQNKLIGGHKQKRLFKLEKCDVNFWGRNIFRQIDFIRKWTLNKYE